MPDIIARAKAHIAANRPALLTKAKRLLRQWHDQPSLGGSIVYRLNDQDHFADLYTGMRLTDEEYTQLCESIVWGDNQDPGDLDIWIVAAQALGFTDYVTELKRIKQQGI